MLLLFLKALAVKEVHDFDKVSASASQCSALWLFGLCVLWLACLCQLGFLI